MAVKGGHKDIVEYLIVERHADINSKDNKGVSPHIRNNFVILEFTLPHYQCQIHVH